MFPIFYGGQAPSARTRTLFCTPIIFAVTMALVFCSAIFSPVVAKNKNVQPSLTTSTASENFKKKFQKLDQRPELFNTLTLKSNRLPVSNFFVQVMTNAVAEKPTYEECEIAGEKCPARLLAWRALVRDLKPLGRRAQIAKLNAAINDLVTYKSDLRAFGVKDYWATPIQTLNSGGDCEDFAILKYITLRELGFREDALRLVVVQDTSKNVTHAITTVVVKGKTYALDNQFSAPVGAKDITHYRPVYSVSARQRWIHLAIKKHIRKKIAVSKPF